MSHQSNEGRHIVAMGGGGFSMEEDNPLLDDYVLALAGKDTPRVCFVPTASGDAQTYIEKFYRFFPEKRAKASHLALFQGSEFIDPEKLLLGQDVIYVGGGSTANALAVWRVHGIDRILRLAWESGIVLTGISAGMNCWFEGSVTDSFGSELVALVDGLGFLEGSACPHYDGEPMRRPAYHRLIGEGKLAPGYAAEDGAALHFVGRKLVEAVTSRKAGKAYYVTVRRGDTVEKVLEIRYLGEE
jgi:dipeptidase E